MRSLLAEGTFPGFGAIAAVGLLEEARRDTSCYGLIPPADKLTEKRIDTQRHCGSSRGSLDDQAKLGVQVVNQDAVPESGPANRGLWWRIPNVTAVFADLKGSTALSSSVPPEAAAIAYTYFI